MNKDPIKVLLLEDDEDDFIMTRDLLSDVEGKTYDIEWVSSCEEAFENIESKTYDIILLDYRLGKMTGITLMRQVIERGCIMPFILLTGQDSQETDLEAMEAGASDYLVKGEFNPNMLERSIRYAIEQKKAEAQIRRMALYDHLTKLPNRVLFRDNLKYALEQSKRYKRMSAVLFIDIDNFKRVNDTFGHAVGDELLQRISELLIQSVRLSDAVSRNTKGEDKETIARFGGDEFMILLTEINKTNGAEKVAKRILESFNTSILLDGRDVFVRASIGIALCPTDGTEGDTLLKNADAAMYHAKSLGKNNYQFYKSSMNASSLEKLTLENHLHNALAQEELMLYYQPQIDAQTGKITGMEALMRWQHAELGMVLPSKFIPIAEDTGLILPMGIWLLNTACAQNKAWKDAGLEPGRIAVNLSARQFNEYNLVQSVKEALSESGLAPRWLELEITENVIMQKTEVTIDILNELKAMGVQFAIDDFGTGYSSLAYLKKFPIDRIKIDRSFIQDMTSSPDSVAIVAAIIAMAKTLHLSVIAEGVETDEQRAMIVEQGCPHIQGFLYSKPLPADQATAFLQKYSSANFKIESIKHSA